MLYFCCDDDRREAVRGHPILNGIDFLEVVDSPAMPKAERQRTLRVYFLKPAGLAGLTPDNIRIEGGERIRHVRAVRVTVDEAEAHALVVDVNEPGDFSTYTLRLITSAANPTQPPGFDPVLSAVDFSFKVECPNDFDCQPEAECPPEALPQPEINYLAKDYASFRRLMLDQLAALAPDWRERSAADLGVVLVEVLAYVADHMSYAQDAIATEAYLGTARRRVSIRRHARLVDYRLHDGCNSRAWVQVRLQETLALPAGVPLPRLDAANNVRTRFLTRCVETRQVTDTELPRVLTQFQPTVFEPLYDVVLYQPHNEMRFYTWGARECCLPEGATRATLRDDPAARLRLRPGDVLIFEERLGPRTGQPADADRTHRQAVRLTRVAPEAALVLDAHGGEIDRTAGPLAVDPLTQAGVVQIEWAAEDALIFPLCVSSLTDPAFGRQPVSDVSVALGNLVLADHGYTRAGEDLGAVPQPTVFLPPATSADRCAHADPVPAPPRFNPTLGEGLLTQAAPYRPMTALSARAAVSQPMDEVQPQIALAGLVGGVVQRWQAQRDLLNSAANARDFVVEIESDLQATVRFGDDQHGMRPNSGTQFIAFYRVGNGARGNVSAEALAHMVVGAVAAGAIDRVRNPLAAGGGVEPESIADVRARAPAAFRTQRRAVTAQDYADRARSFGGVQQAAASFRWTGSWHTVFVTADRLGGAEVTPAFRESLRDFIEPYRMAGYDLEVDAPRPVALEVSLRVCVKPDYFRSEVKAALLRVFSNRVLPSGRLGVFHPDNFSFGQTVYLSRLYEAAMGVEGVASVLVTQFERRDRRGPQGLRDRRLTFGRLEIPRLDNNPNFPERGLFHLAMEGGK